ncbi:hypothetical protein M8C21_028619 [Ambrosia artemisiifolia]|uniref:CHORD domain-containing protein n=1 Tax=Ambrosia artemisiifolia TaxID=4212 RepID=A0AAD5BRB0_AMBAR|nr:hypothetical protein M8C21_028619 [Ambrosia artemisiifolia]
MSNMLRCQRIGCNATFTEDNNPEDSCTYHESSGVVARKRVMISLYFWKFLGKHTTEKPVLAKAPAAPKPAIKTSTPAANVSAKEACPRCRQGFFCSDHGFSPNLTQFTQHGSQVKDMNSKPSYQVQSTPEEGNSDLQESAKPPVKKIVDINQPQICKNKGCGQTFKEIDNHDTACNYHPGPAVFHDRLRGWKCCDVHVKEFDEFMTIPPCTKGWHNADAAS